MGTPLANKNQDFVTNRRSHTCYSDDEYDDSLLDDWEQYVEEDQRLEEEYAKVKSKIHKKNDIDETAFDTVTVYDGTASLPQFGAFTRERTAASQRSACADYVQMRKIDDSLGVQEAGFTKSMSKQMVAVQHQAEPPNRSCAKKHPVRADSSVTSTHHQYKYQGEHSFIRLQKLKLIRRPKKQHRSWAACDVLEDLYECSMSDFEQVREDSFDADTAEDWSDEQTDNDSCEDSFDADTAEDWSDEQTDNDSCEGSVDADTAEDWSDEQTDNDSCEGSVDPAFAKTIQSLQLNEVHPRYVDIMCRALYALAPPLSIVLLECFSSHGAFRHRCLRLKHQDHSGGLSKSKTFSPPGTTIVAPEDFKMIDSILAQLKFHLDFFFEHPEIEAEERCEALQALHRMLRFRISLVHRMLLTAQTSDVDFETWAESFQNDAHLVIKFFSQDFFWTYVETTSRDAFDSHCGDYYGIWNDRGPFVGSDLCLYEDSLWYANDLAATAFSFYLYPARSACEVEFREHFMQENEIPYCKKPRPSAGHPDIDLLVPAMRKRIPAEFTTVLGDVKTTRDQLAHGLHRFIKKDMPRKELAHGLIGYIMNLESLLQELSTTAAHEVTKRRLLGIQYLLKAFREKLKRW